MARVKRPRGPGAQLCGSCGVMTPNTELQHISVVRPQRKRGWVCDTCVTRISTRFAS